jgi:programmed cell death protein 5
MVLEVPEQAGSNQEDEKIQKALQKRMRVMQEEQQKRELARRFMTPEAYERLMNVRISNRELYSQLINLILAMVQQNRLSGKLTEEQLKQILGKLTFRPEPTIEYKHK